MEDKTKKVIIWTTVGVALVSLGVVIAQIMRKKASNGNTLPGNKTLIGTGSQIPGVTDIIRYNFHGETFTLDQYGNLNDANGDNIDVGVKTFDTKNGIIYYFDGSSQDVNSY